MGDTLYIVMPAYNEEANIRNVVAEWYPILDYASEKSKMIIFCLLIAENVLS